MPSSAFVWPILWAVVSSAIAVGIQRRWPHAIHAARWVTVGWALACVIAFMTIIGHGPPRPWSPQALAAEPWESVLLPLVGLCLVWPLLRGLLHRWPHVRLWALMAAASLPLIASLTPPTDGYATLLPGNAAWACGALLAIGANALACERWDVTGASRWALWVFVAQLLCTAALIKTCYGTFGDWCVVVALCLACAAFARLFTSAGVWSTALGIPATTLCCILLMHIRDYSSIALPPWLAPVPMLMPTLVALVDSRFGVGHDLRRRVALAAGVSVALSVAILAIVLWLGSSGS